MAVRSQASSSGTSTWSDSTPAVWLPLLVLQFSSRSLPASGVSAPARSLEASLAQQALGLRSSLLGARGRLVPRTWAMGLEAHRLGKELRHAPPGFATHVCCQATGTTRRPPWFP